MNPVIGGAEKLQIYVIRLMTVSEAGLSSSSNAVTRWNNMNITGSCQPQQELYLSYGMLDQSGTDITDRSEAYLLSTRFDTITGGDDGAFSWTSPGLTTDASMDDYFPFYNDIGLESAIANLTDYTAVVLWCY